MNAGKYQEKRNESDSRMVAKEGKKENAFVLLAERLVVLLFLFCAWLILSGKRNRQITRNPVKTTQELKRPDMLVFCKTFLIQR